MKGTVEIRMDSRGGIPGIFPSEDISNSIFGNNQKEQQKCGSFFYAIK